MPQFTMLKEAEGRMILGDSLGWGDGDKCLGTQVGQSSQNRAPEHTENTQSTKLIKKKKDSIYNGIKNIT